LNNDRVSEAYYGDIFTSSTKKYLIDRVDWMVEQSKGANVLDVGCSQGIVSILLARNGVSVFGLDVNEQAINYAEKEKMKETVSVQKNLQFVSGDIFKMDFKERFNTVILGEILEHLDDPQNLIQIVANLLTPDGRLVITIPFGINDHDDHQQTFYISNIINFLNNKIQLKELVIIGKWLCISANKIDGEVTKVDYKDFLKISEEAFYRLEKNYLESQYKKDKRIKELSLKLQERQEKIDKLKLVYNSYQYRIGKYIISALKPGKDTFLLPYRLLNLLHEKYKQSVKN
jgi:SAM-dependent methyltransferase